MYFAKEKNMWVVITKLQRVFLMKKKSLKFRYRKEACHTSKSKGKSSLFLYVLDNKNVMY